MTSQGTAYGRFRRAIKRRQLFHAELAARELGRLTLADALDLLTLIAAEDRSRFDRAALRWHSRFVSEAKGLKLWESHVVLGSWLPCRKMPRRRARSLRASLAGAAFAASPLDRRRDRADTRLGPHRVWAKTTQGSSPSRLSRCDR